MTGPMQPTQCLRCGQLVLPEVRTGAWVDQYNGRFCGGNPQAPHVGQAPGYYPPMPPEQYGPGSGGGRKKALFIGGGAVAAVLVIALVVVLVLVNKSPSGNENQAQAGPASSSAPPPSPTSSKPPANPDAPTPCDPDRKNGYFCFPAKVTGKGYLDRIAQDMKWPCFKKGDKDSTGMDVTDPGVCRASNNVDQPYIVSIEIGYDTDTHDLNGTMSTVHIVASTGSRAWKNEKTDAGKTAEIAVDAVGIAVPNLWPDNKALQKEATDAFKKVQEQCSKTSGASMDDMATTLSIGYTVSCSSISTIAVSDPRGTVTSLTETLRIDVPIGGPK